MSNTGKYFAIWSDVKTTLVHYEGVDKPITQEQFLSTRRRALEMGLLALDMCLLDGRYKKNQEFRRIGIDYLRTHGAFVK